MPEIKDNSVFPPVIEPIKPKFRCINNVLFGYCVGEPNSSERQENEVRPFVLGSCQNNPENCMNFRYLSEIVDWSELDALLEKTRLVETITDANGNKIEKTETPEKKKTKKAQKLEGEIAQQSMFGAQS